VKVEAVFVVSAATARDLPRDRVAEIALVGRSNVGKSSLINALVRQRVARTSGAPGKTRLANVYRIRRGTEPPFYLVDLPGYGYARISKEKKSEWRPMIAAYLKRTSQLRGIVLLLDTRREPTDDDRAMLDFLAEVEVPTIVALTKTDRLSKSAAHARTAEISQALALDADQVIPFSSVTGAGRVELLEAIAQLVEPQRSLEE